MIRPLTFATLTTLLLAGCSSNDGSHEVELQQEEISTLLEKIDRLESEKDERIEEAAAQARAEERDEIAQQMHDLRQQLTTERDELGELKQRHEFERHMDSELERVSERIDALEEEAEDAAPQRAAAIQRQIADLQIKHTKTQRLLRQLRASSGETWSLVKEKTQDAWSELTAALDKSRQTPVSKPEPSAETDATAS